MSSDAGPSGRAFLGVGLRPLACWDCGFESRREHGCLSVVNVVCCFQVEVSATSWPLIHRSPTECGVSECDLETSWMRNHTQSMWMSLNRRCISGCISNMPLIMTLKHDCWMSSDRLQWYWEIKKKSPLIVCFVGEGNAMSLYNYCLFCISYFSWWVRLRAGRARVRILFGGYFLIYSDTSRPAPRAHRTSTSMDALVISPG